MEAHVVVVYAPFTVKLGVRCGWLVTLMSASLYPRRQRFRGWMDPRAFRDDVEEREIFCTCEESNHGLSVGRLGHSLKEIAVNPVCVHLLFSTIAGIQGKHKSSSIAVQNFLCRPAKWPLQLAQVSSVCPSVTYFVSASRPNTHTSYSFQEENFGKLVFFSVTLWFRVQMSLSSCLVILSRESQ